MVSVRRDNGKRGTIDPALLITRSLGTIDRMAEAMWRDEGEQQGKPRQIHWRDVGQQVHEKWTRHATAAFLVLLEPCPHE